MNGSVRTERERFREVAAAAPAGARVPVECSVTVDDPFDAFRRARDGPGGFFYETTGGQPGWGYFGIDPVERLTVSEPATVADADAVGGAPESTGDYRRPTPTLAALEGVVDGEELARGDCSVPYPCGVFGWLSYDVARELESFPAAPPDGPGARDDRGLPQLQAAVFDRVAAWECPVETGSDEDVELRVTACPTVPAAGDTERLDEAFESGVDRARELIDRIRTGEPAVGPPPTGGAAERGADRGGSRDAGRGRNRDPAATFESDTGREAYADAVRRVKAYVRDGDTFQANVSQRLRAPATVHPVTAYDALRRVNPAPYSGLVEFERDGLGADLVSASPELLLERVPTDDPERDARLVTEPIAGTRPRGGDPEADAALEAELTGEAKERAEHAMLVDLERNDLGKVSRFGTVDVAEYRRVDRYSEVMHLVSLIEGEARRDVGLADALAACFPGGTITGAPKPRTMEIIDELEETRRGPYTGSMFAAGFDGRLTANIVIRTLVRTGSEYSLRVGAGIVHDSEPDAEYAETLAKGRALVTAIDEALTGEELEVAAATDDAGGETR
ncbi:anthranilate synthase component 1 [Halorubrum alkaliphilum]|uniref:anthranilate synthase n=1 Tax=Halorubrum alkaliphilum TaxID=261290 RepID=A0A8T4GK22_9EURY|nr:anthranilate synthase component I family protein [Halorubrum alkaliphilum]MBP1923940.1 anthranilate synthase component 1 [Halorubrum alkaliphilum]